MQSLVNDNGAHIVQKPMPIKHPTLSHAVASQLRRLLARKCTLESRRRDLEHSLVTTKDTAARVSVMGEIRTVHRSLERLDEHLNSVRRVCHRILSLALVEIQRCIVQQRRGQVPSLVVASRSIARGLYSTRGLNVRLIETALHSFSEIFHLRSSTRSRTSLELRSAIRALCR
jgi:hypothetical protein